MILPVRSHRLRVALVAALAVAMLAVAGPQSSAALTASAPTSSGSTASRTTEQVTSATRTPVIFLHGITGSFLRNPSGEVWPSEGRTASSLSDDHLDVLRLQADGRTPWRATDPAYQISVDRGHGISGVIDQAELCLLSACMGVSDVYKPTFEHLEGRGYRRGVDLVPFAFDWRRDVDTNAQLLLDEIDQVRARTGAAKVNLMAHSQGGLVARAALGSSRSVGKVDRVATLGTPMLGATEFLGILDYREPCQSAELFGGCILNRAKAQQLVTNWPGSLALLPSPSYYQAYGSPINRLVDDNRDGRNEGYLSPSQVRAKLADRNLVLIDQATALQRRVEPWAPLDPSVTLTRFVGTGLGSIERVEEFLTEKCSGALWWRKCALVESFRMQYGNGDGTVALHSADVYDPARGLDLRGSGVNRYVAGVDHGDLVTDAAVLNEVVAFFEGAGTAGASVTSSKDSGTTQTATVQSAPEALDGLEVTSLGPLAGQVLDTAGRRAGADDPSDRPATDEIPGASAATGERNSTFFLTRDDRYRTRWEATEDGDVTLQLHTYDADRIVSVRSIGPVNVRAGALLSLDVSVPLRPGVLRLVIDDDSDGRADRRIAVRPVVRGAGANDRLAPEAEVALRPFTAPDGQRLVEVTVEATDRGGSGVDRVDYALDTSTSSAEYTGPFIVPAGGTLHVRAVDRAGNVSAPYLRVPLG